MGVQDLMSIQVGKETTWGTGVTDTAKLMGFKSFKLSPVLDALVLPEIRASLAPGFVGAIKGIGGAGEGEFHAFYEDLNYWLEACFGEVTPSGAGPYTRAGTAPLATSPTLRKHTVYHGDATGTYKLLGGLVSQLVLRGDSAGPLMGKVKLIGKSVTTGTLAALSDRTVNPIMGDHAGTIAIDAWGGTIGTTTLTLTAWAWELTINPVIALLRYFGSLSAGAHAVRAFKPEANTLKLSLEFNATSKAYVDELIAGTLHQRQIRIKHDNGSSLQFQLDFAGTATKPPSALYDYREGVASVDLEYQGTYNTALANWLKYQTKNSVSALP